MRRLGVTVGLLVAVPLFSALPAFAQGVGLFHTAPTGARQNCTDITSPVTNQTWCLNATRNTLNVYDGTGYQSTAARAGRFVYVTDPRFGAVSDSGSTDNLAAFNAAAAAAGAGGTIVIPPSTTGYYALSGVWTLNNLPGIKILGGGATAMVVAAGAGNAITVTNSNGYVIRDLTISGETGSGHGIQIGSVGNPSHYGIIENVFIRGVDGNGIDFQGGIISTVIRPAITTNRALPFTVAGVGTTKKGINIRRHPSGFNNSITIISPLIEGMGTHGIDVGGDDMGAGAGTVSTNIFAGTVEGNGNRAGSLGNVDHANIRLVSGPNTRINGVYMEQNNDVERNVIIDNSDWTSLDQIYNGTNLSTRGQIEVTNSDFVTLRHVFGGAITIDVNSDRTTLFQILTDAVVGASLTNNGTNTRILTHIVNATPQADQWNTGMTFGGPVVVTPVANGTLLVGTPSTTNALSHWVTGGNANYFAKYQDNQGGLRIYGIANGAQGAGVFSVDDIGAGLARFQIGPTGNLFAGSNQFVSASGSLTNVSFLFADLNLVLTANGMQVYCSDCNIANPCTGAGTGALAKRLNGIFVCN